MSEWKEYRLGDILSIKSGFSYKGKYIGTGDSLLLGMGCVSFKEKFLMSGARPYSGPYDERYKVYPGDIVLATRQQSDNLPILAMPAMVPSSLQGKDIVIGTNLYKVEITDKSFSNDYIFWLLKTKRYVNYIAGVKTGTTVSMVTKKNVEDFTFLAPTNQKERENIVDTMSSLDDKIAINRRICENLEAQAQAIFKHWFIDFAPFKNGKFVESELGMIPEGWRVGRLGEYVDNLSGYSYKGNELQPSTIAMATIKNFVRGGGFKIEGYKEIIISKNIKEYQYVNLFDVLVAHTDLTQNAEVVGNPAIILSTAGYEKLIMSMDLTKVVSKDVRITPQLLYSILGTRKFKEHALGYVNGTTVLHMSKKAVPEYQLVMPKNLDILKNLTSVLGNLYSLMSETYEENLRLSSLRDTLLPKLMSGEIKV